jgi:hypothetical protein
MNPAIKGPKTGPMQGSGVSRDSLCITITNLRKGIRYIQPLDLIVKLVEMRFDKKK